MDLSTWRAWTSAPKVNTSVFYRPQLNTTAVLQVSRHAAAQTRRRKHRGREEWVQAGFGELHRKQNPISVVCCRSSRFPQWKNNYILPFFSFFFWHLKVDLCQVRLTAEPAAMHAEQDLCARCLKLVNLESSLLTNNTKKTHKNYYWQNVSTCLVCLQVAEVLFHVFV